MRFAIVAGLALGCLHAQVTLAPERLKWGESLQLTYDPSAKGAQFRLTDPVWASLTVYFEDHSTKRIAGAMTVVDGRLQYRVTIPEGACSVEIAFVTAHDYDAAASSTVVIARPDGRPARGANDHLMWSHMADAERYFQQEIALYPDNFAAYRHRWFLGDGGKEQPAPAIQSDLQRIGASGPQPSVEWLYAMSYAYARLGDSGRAKSAIEQLMQRFPDSPLTDDALNYYLFRSSGDAKRQAEQWESALVAAHPASAHAGYALPELAARADFPFEVVQRVTGEQLRREPDNPAPYLAVATASLTHKRDYGPALDGLQAALRLLLEGKYRILFDRAGTLTERRLAEAYRLRAEIQLAQGDVPDALASVKASEAFERDNATAGHLLESRIWSALSDSRRAEAAKLEASRRGSPAPKRPFAFDVISLDGKHWSLVELKGKTIALNFWFVGCAPCRQEIPVLNQLVEQYKDVVFLAFALDAPEQLRDFLKTFPFRYQIVPNSQKVADGYRVAAYPTHIVIGPTGDIIFEGNEDLAGLKAALAR
jgi:thiol-disulfide isomerase/thioredoxin